MNELRQEMNKIRWEKWRSEQKNEREKSYFFCWGDWSDCNVVSGPYIDFYIKNWRSGQSGCQGGTGSWNTAVCLRNAVARWARANKGSDFYEYYSHCYWREKSGCPEHCFVETEFNLPVYMVYVWNNDMGYGHFICAEYLGGDMKNFDNWKFFQYINLDIQPGDPGQMPCGTEEENTKVDIYQVTHGTHDPNCSCFHGDSIVIFEIDKDCYVTCVYP